MGFEFLGINENSYIWQTQNTVLQQHFILTMMHCEEGFMIWGWQPLKNWLMYCTRTFYKAVPECLSVS